MLQRNQDQGKIDEGVLKLKMVIREAYANYQGAWLGANGGTNLLMF
jgi:hypothetical protein